MLGATPTKVCTSTGSAVGTFFASIASFSSETLILLESSALDSRGISFLQGVNENLVRVAVYRRFRNLPAFS